MHISARVTVTLPFAAMLLAAAPAAAQRFTFDRTLTVGTAASLDALTDNGKIEVLIGEPGRVTVHGTVTVRVGLRVPADAIALAQQAAEQPPVEQAGDTVRLHLPEGADTRRAVTVSYEVRVPPQAAVTLVSGSGAIKVDGVGGALTIKTSSSQVDVSRSGAAAVITSGSGAVSVVDAGGLVTVSTGSSAIDLRGLRAGLKASTQSGRLSATFDGDGDVDVQTGSSAITLTGVRGALNVSTRSGQVTVNGTPIRPWTMASTSGSMHVGIPAAAALTVDAITKSGSITAAQLNVTGTIEKRHVAGPVGAGGPLVHLISRSGSIHLHYATP